MFLNSRFAYDFAVISDLSIGRMCGMQFCLFTETPIWFIILLPRVRHLQMKKEELNASFITGLEMTKVIK